MELKFKILNDIITRTDNNDIKPHAPDVTASFIFDSTWADVEVKKVKISDMQDTEFFILDSLDTCAIERKYIDTFGFTLQIFGLKNNEIIKYSNVMFLPVINDPKGIGGDIEQATETKLGGIKAAPKTSTDNTEVRIDTSSGKLYVHTVGSYTLPQATDDALGGIKADTITSEYYHPIGINVSTGKLFANVLIASRTKVGGVKAKDLPTQTYEDGYGEYTEEVKIDPSSEFLYSRRGGRNLNLTNNTLQLLDSANNLLSSVDLPEDGKIDTISVNGVNQPITNKNVNIVTPVIEILESGD